MPSSAQRRACKHLLASLATWEARNTNLTYFSSLPLRRVYGASGAQKHFRTASTGFGVNGSTVGGHMRPRSLPQREGAVRAGTRPFENLDLDI